MNNGPQWVEAEAQFPDGRRVFASNNIMANSPNFIWVDDSIPTGGQPGADGGDAWNWVSGNPTPYSGSLAQQSAIASGEHQVDFDNATATLTVETNAVLYAWIYLDPSHPPAEAMLQWDDGSWEHRAYWGANQLTFGIDGTASRTNMGPLPAAGQWAQLKVPANLVNLAGSTVNGLAFTLYGGRATWDCAGALNAMTTSTNSTVTVNASSAVVSRAGATPATFTLSRTGNASAPLTVSCSLGGTAAAGVDYQVSPSGQPASQVVFPAGATSATMSINPLNPTNIVGSQTIVLTLSAGGSYAVGAPAAATMSLAGNNVPTTSMQMSGGSPTFTWASSSNAIYRVLYKNNLTDPVWLPAGSDITATGAASTWSDTNTANATQRFYVVMLVQ
jgi:hypothetical protein